MDTKKKQRYLGVILAQSQAATYTQYKNIDKTASRMFSFYKALSWNKVKDTVQVDCLEVNTTC